MKEHRRVWRTIVPALITLGLLLAALTLGDRLARAAISVGTATSASGSTASLTFSHTVPSGSNRALVVVTGHRDGNKDVTNITYGGVALSQAIQRNGSSNSNEVNIWYLVNPTVGTANVVVTVSGSVDIAASAINLTGVHQTTPVGTSVGSAATSSAPSVTVSSAANELVIGAVAANGDAVSVSSGGGQSGLINTGTGTAGGNVRLAADSAVGASSVNFSWTLGASKPWGAAAVPFKPAVPSISGTVFEDMNYGGGAGRNLSTSNANGGGLVSGAIVELYSSAGAYLTNTTTDSNGNYTFYGLPSSTNYYVRVVSTTVKTTRSCNNSCSGTAAVMTYRTTATGGAAAAVTDWVGGTNPSTADPGTASSGASFSTSTYVYSAGLSGTAHAVAPVTTGSTVITGVDFGFSFDVVSNNNNSGQGSLRQYILNANEIIATGLAISGGVANLDNAVFMISNGTAAAGLRSGNNYFSGGVTTITLTSAFPAIIGCVIDARNQPGWAGTPVVVLSGSGLSGSIDGFQLNGQNTTGVTLAGFVIRNFPRYGVNAYGGGNTVKGNWVGLTSAGTAAAANAGDGIYVAAGSSGDVIGGTGTYDGNVTSGNSGSGIRVQGSSTVVQGNISGLNAAGTAAVPNGGDGLTLDSATGAIVGGTTASARNIFSGNTAATADGIWISYGSGHTIKGNWIGLDSSGNTTIGNGHSGMNIAGSSNNTVGGTAAAEANIIAGNSGAGIDVQPQSSTGATGNRISGNSIYNNTGLGIDINEDGVTANNGSTATGIGNLGMDFPVFTTATISGTTLTVAGYVGSAAGQTAFANAVVEVFIADTTAAGNGEGKTYLGTLTANGSGNFSGTISGVSGITGGTTRITGTARDGSNNTSEFGANVVVTRLMIVSGTVFEDSNYGGGAGRNKATASGGGVNGARVELYNSSATYVSATTTASDGSYSFSGLTAGVYFVRVVNSTVLSSRSGSTASLVPVMTHRTEVAAGTVTDVLNEVGGLNPVKVDAASGAGGTTLWTSCAAENGTCSFTGMRTVRYGGTNAGGTNSGWVTRILTGGTACSNAVFGDPISGTGKSCYLLNADYQSVSTVNANAGDVAGVDFGFNFDTVVNTNDSGQGSLRQAITNANTLGGDSSLAQSGRTAGLETVLFMISNGTAGGGLRSTLNYFTGGIATISPTSALPDASTPMAINAQTQPGWTSAPIVELNGAGAGASVAGITTRGGTAVRGLIINRYTGNGVQFLDASGNTLAGCYIGTNSAGTAASANGGVGLNVFNSPNNTIGGTAAGASNVISGNTGIGVNITGTSSGQTIQGNTIGLNAAGTGRVANGSIGVFVNAAGATIGGTSTAARNVIAGNTYENLQLGSSGGTAVVQGNYFGTDASGAVGPVNGGDNIVANSSGNQIGGTAANAGNVIAGATGRGVKISGNVTGNAVLGNSIFGNSNIGIDLAADGQTTNDGAKTAGQPNLLMDYPVLTSASLASTTLTLGGYVGSAAGQSTFANARVEVFISDASNANGQGKTYLGFLTADASGNFSGTITGVSGVTNGTTRITATATDASNNTSEFGPNVTAGYMLTGTVFEDLNYGGGAGRTLAASGGVGLAGAQVELYNSSGTYVSTTTTVAGGGYAFPSLAAGSYYLRVVSSSVLSSRSGSVATLVPVLTYRTNASSGSAVAVTDFVGGTNPALADPGAAGSGAAFNTSTLVYSAGLSGTAQNVAPVTIGSSGISGLDFGFNFDAVVNTNDSGQGSLRQAITNANTLAGDAALAQAGRTAAVENLVFMISNGTAAAGLRSANNYFSGGVATIAPASGLPSVSTSMVIDAQTQPGWTASPVLQLNGTSTGGICLQLSGGSSTLRGFIINRCPGDALDISGGSNHVVQGNWIGVDSTGTAASGITSSTSRGIGLANVGGVQIGGTTAAQRNVLSGNNYSGIYIGSNTTTLTIRGNYIGTNAAGTAAVGNAVGGIRWGSGISGSTGITVGGSSAGQGNVISGNTGVGIRVTLGGPVIAGNIIGLNAAGNATLANTSDGIQLLTSGAGATIGGTTAGSGNVIAGNGGRGVNVLAPVATAAIQGNSIYGNTSIGIDLGNDGATANDGAKTAGQANQLMDTPVLTAATIGGTTLTVAGYVGSAAGQSTFANARVEIFVSDASNPNGQGKTYLGFVTSDASGNFSGTITGVSGVTNGSTRITATATDGSNNTSEFGPNLTVGMIVSGTVFEDVNYGGGAGRTLAGSGGIGLAGAVVEMYDSGGNYVGNTTSAAGGAYSFPGVAAGNYYIRVSSSSVVSQRSGGSSALPGVLTYRTNASSGSAVAVTDGVGGTNPAAADPGAGSSGTTLNTTSFVFSAGLSGTAHAVTPVTVSSSGVGGIDFGFNFDTVVNTNDSGQGSLRQAIINANTLGGDASLAQSGRTAAIENLVFMISNGTAAAGLRSANNYFSGGVASISPASALPTLSTAMVVDAQTQPGWSANPVIEVRGDAAGSVVGMTLSGGSSIVRGLVVNRFAGGGVSITAGGSYALQGNWIGLTNAGTAAAANGIAGLVISSNGSGFQIGGTSAAQRNVISGNTGYGFYASAGSGYVVQGNYIGTRADGSAAVGNTSRGVWLDSGVGSATLGGTAAGAGNVISGNPDYAVWLAGAAATVQGNIIGLNAAGTAALANAYGIWTQSTGHLIGGTTAAARNVISGNTNRGIWLNSNANTVQGNYVGTNATGAAALPNGTQGIYVKGDNNTVGGTAAGAGNLISGNTGDGVRVSSGNSGNAILSNAIYANGALGIDLNGDGVTANDGAKTAGAGNLLMDSPVFTSARATGSQLVVAGYVGSAASQNTFANARVEVYLSDNDASGYGEGKTYLGALTSDASGNFSGTLTMPVAGLAIGSKLTGTATDGSNNTSEFGVNFSGLIVDMVVNSNGDAFDASIGDGLCNTAGGVCTLRAAIAEINASAAGGATPSIVFAIPGCSSYGSAACKITPASALPSITRSVLIDGTTQTGFNTGTYAPIIEIDGSAAPASTTGLVVSANNSTLRGLTINRFSGNGVTFSGSGNSLLGNRIGLAVNSAAKAANGSAGAYITGTGSSIGGSSAADRNVIAGNTGAGLLIAASNTSVSSNYLGTDSNGTASLGNTGAGILVQSASLTGVSVSGNTIANNSGPGVNLAAGGPAQVQILGNAISGNGGLGIDLGNDGVTANTGSSDSSKPNNGMNMPVVTGAGVGSGSMTVYGYVGTGSGQAAFAGARVEFFKAAVDATGYGEGQVYLGYLTADAAGRFSGTISVSAPLSAGDVITATATDGSGNTSEFGPNWTSTTVAALTPGSFNAFDTDAAANALTGVIRSRIAGSATNLAVIALDNSGTALHPGFTGTVNLSWVDARNDSGAATGSCRASWVDLGSAGVATFSNSSRVTVSVTPPASGTRVMRLKMTYTNGGSTTTACSNDAFADLPASLTWINASDADSGTAGTTRVLDNINATGGVVHRAGRAFTVRAQARDATGAVMTGYDGSPVLAAAGCLLPSGCTAAALTASNTAAVSGNYTHSNVSYAEVGAIQLQLTDSSYADIDVSDTAVGVRTLTSALLSVGRFIPDTLSLSISTNGQLATANAACMASGSGATFFGQGFTWATVPQVTVTAKNAAGATTTRWTGSLMKLVASSSSETLTVSAAGSATLSASYGSMAVQDLGSGQARVTASSTDRFVLDIPGNGVQDSQTPNFAWNISVADSSEVATTGNPTLSASTNQASVTFNSGGVFHSGRLSLSPGYGDVRAGVRLLAQVQRYTSAGWVSLTEDRGCVTIQPANVGVESPSGVFTTAGVCAAPMQASVTTQGGRAWLTLPGTPGGSPGRLTLRLAGQAATGNSCTPAGATAALVPLGLPWLTGGSSGAGPQALATWGATQRDAVLRRETW